MFLSSQAFCFQKKHFRWAAFVKLNVFSLLDEIDFDLLIFCRCVRNHFPAYGA